MGKKYGDFKYSIGDTIKKNTGYLLIIDREYRSETKSKRGKEYAANTKWYKYKCMSCGNTDWIREYSLDVEGTCGCNVCCTPPKKIVDRINDVATMEPWIKCYVADSSILKGYSKYSKESIEFTCPNCGMKHIKRIDQVVANHGLSCPCSDKWSYPNKFMYSLLNQLQLPFEPEKRFTWSGDKSYDDYIEYDGLKIITEQHGNQHYNRPIAKSVEHRSLRDEKINDELKRILALSNGIDYYFQIDCSKSDLDYIKGSICKSGLLKLLNIEQEDVDWEECDKFATSNIIKSVCDYAMEHPYDKQDEIAHRFHLCRKTICNYLKHGRKFGWYTMNTSDIRSMLDSANRIDHGGKPIKCITTGVVYENASDASVNMLPNQPNRSRQIRKSIDRNSTYMGYAFAFV